MCTGYCSAMLLHAFPLKTCHPCIKINAHSSHTNFVTPAFPLMMLKAQCTPNSTTDHMPRLSCPQRPIVSPDGVACSLSCILHSRSLLHTRCMCCTSNTPTCHTLLHLPPDAPRHRVLRPTLARPAWLTALSSTPGPICVAVTTCRDMAGCNS